MNGKFVGYSEDSKIGPEFDVTKYLKKGENQFAFQVFRWSDGSYCEDQDFWRLSGVARESYLYARDAKQHLKDIRVTPDLRKRLQDATLSLDLQLVGSTKAFLILEDADNNLFYKTVVTADKEGQAKAFIDTQKPREVDG